MNKYGLMMLFFWFCFSSESHQPSSLPFFGWTDVPHFYDEDTPVTKTMLEEVATASIGLGLSRVAGFRDMDEAEKLKAFRVDQWGERTIYVFKHVMNKNIYYSLMRPSSGYGFTSWRMISFTVMDREKKCSKVMGSVDGRELRVTYDGAKCETEFLDNDRPEGSEQNE